MEKKGWSEIISAAVEKLISLEKHEEEEEKLVLSTMTFLSFSNLILLQVLDKIGPTMAVPRQDVQLNIERLEEFYALDPANCTSLGDMLKKEVREGTARKASSCARAILWLTRSMDFAISLLERLERDSELSLVQAVEETYKNTLKPWHGWISSAAYKVALKLIPERKFFINLLIDKKQNHDVLKRDTLKLASLLKPFLSEIHTLLRKFRLDRLKSI